MKSFIEMLKKERKYIIIASLIFFISGILGFIYAEEIQHILKQLGILDKLKQIAKTIEKNPSYLYSFLTIFINNLEASLTIMGLGLIFIFIPFFCMMLNGLLLGTTLGIVSDTTGLNPLIIFSTTILPHGILEIPAIILSAGFGFHLGVAAIKRLVALVNSKKLEASQLEWKGIRKRIPVVLFSITLFLFIAALIEAGLIVCARP